MATGAMTVGGTFILTHAAKKDGVVWDLTGATVTVYLGKPSGTVVGPFTATVAAPTTGVATYTTLAGATPTLSEDGRWWAVWRVVQGAIDVDSERMHFPVEPGRTL